MARPQLRRKPEKPTFWTWVRWGGLFFLIAAIGGKHIGVLTWTSGRGVEAGIHCGGGSFGVHYLATERPTVSPVSRPEFRMDHPLSRHPGGTGRDGFGALSMTVGGIAIGCFYLVAAYLLACTSANYWWHGRKARLLKLQTAPPS